MTRVRVVAALAMAAALLSACADVPEPELRGYVGAFDAGRDAGSEVYGELDEAIDRAGRLEAGATVADCGPATPAPRCFDPVEMLPRPAEPREPAIKARLVTYDAVALYNETLIALATGATGAALERRLDQLGGALNMAASAGGAAAPGAGSLAPLLSGPVLEAFTSLAVEIETARANAEARAALLSNKGLIDEAVDLLIADTERVYELYLSARSHIASRTLGGLRSADAKAEFTKITAFHTALGKYVVLLGQMRKSHDALQVALTANNNPESQFDAALEQAVEIGTAAHSFYEAFDAVDP